MNSLSSLFPVHFYNYVDDCLSLAIYPRARYSSEYGYQSWPSYNTLKAISDPVEDLFYGTDFFHHREHHAGGSYLIYSGVILALKLGGRGSGF